MSVTVDQCQQPAALTGEHGSDRLDAAHRDPQSEALHAIHGQLDAQYAAFAHGLRTYLECLLPTAQPLRRVLPVEAPDGPGADVDGNDVERLFAGVTVADVCGGV